MYFNIDAKLILEGQLFILKKKIMKIDFQVLLAEMQYIPSVIMEIIQIKRIVLIVDCLVHNYTLVTN